MIEDLKIWIKNNVLDKNKNPIGIKFSFLLKNKNKHAISILEKTKYLNMKCKISERIYHIMHDTGNNIKCKNSNCFNNVRFINYQYGYNPYCSWDCSNQCIIAKKKYIETCYLKYGASHPWKNKHVQNKKKITNIKKYGVDNPSKSEEIKNKIKKNTLKKYGNENFSLSKLGREDLKKLNDIGFLYNEYVVNKKTSRKISKDLKVAKSTLLKIFHKNNIPINYDFFSSSFEREIIKFLLPKNLIKNTRKIIPPYELDIYLPDIKLAIEFDGLFWHSSKYKQKNYHLMKTKMCEEKDIQLLHIFENEWLDSIKQSIWKSIINSKIGKNNRIFARKCEVKEISNTRLVKQFLNNNHLQGFVGSSVKLGLFYEKDLISLMTFGKSRYTKKYQYEIIRFCNKRNINVTGGASKLFKYFIRNYNPKSIVSYADRRYSNGNLYNILEFEYSHCSAPNYFYFKPGQLTIYPRVKFQKHKLEKQLEIFCSNLSEAENMSNNGYLKIWDCGNMTYVWKT